jgi:hypothetical protein
MLPFGAKQHFWRSFMLAARLALVALVGFLPTLAPAATVSIEMTKYATVDSALTARDLFIGGGPVIGEDFEGFVACTGSNTAQCAKSPLDTAVGQFSGIGPGQTTGGSQVNPKDKVVVRTAAPSPYGRYNVTPGGANWLDSNDLKGIQWDVPGNAGLPMITRIAFLLTDVDDVGSLDFILKVLDVGGGEFIDKTLALNNNGLQNGTLHLVTMLFSDPVKDFQISMINGTGDGFGLDGARIALVPVPAAGLMLLGALGGLAALRRRKKAA